MIAKKPLMTEYRPMTQVDIEAGLALCRAAKWNQLERDWQFFLEHSLSGCLVAEEENKVVGTVATISYQDNFGWIGMVLVDPANRRQGIGIRLLNEALNILQDKETIKLDATPSGREVYLKLGFKDEYRLGRMLSSRVSGTGEKTTAKAIQKEDLAELIKFDKKIFGAERKLLLEWMFTGAPEFAFIVKEYGEVAGYCLGRHGFNFNHIGPVVAKRSDIARNLVVAALQNSLGQAVILDVFQHDRDWVLWLESLGFTEQRDFMRMFRGPNRFPGIPKKQFAILGPEFG
ncbi:GNAT family N-acetyltransferase [Flavihumibacter fluvii]|uniref:GNAT family N-acetyltransferase n=1 Tax=Flavihumibacter fluvii TaxID=2838157 RepID=UPI001BDF5B3C|nr:GNAT family N-acetyltransferase [Flavihumibacter fluvii]ULQ52929.1 GNAT family N-acetyltransferase [Flavihumibacter fluvii]